MTRAGCRSRCRYCGETGVGVGVGVRAKGQEQGFGHEEGKFEETVGGPFLGHNVLRRAGSALTLTLTVNLAQTLNPNPSTEDLQNAAREVGEEGGGPFLKHNFLRVGEAGSSFNPGPSP